MDSGPLLDAAPGLRILLLAPVGRDAKLLGDVLRGAGLSSLSCPDIDGLAHALRGGVGTIVLTEEALAPASVSRLLAELSAAASWSDVPILILADAQRLTAAPAGGIEALRAQANVTVLERPIQRLTLVTAIQASLRARRHQYEVRELMSSQQAARQAAEDARRAAEAASELKDEFLATISHELRTPLAAILLWTRLLGRGGLDAATVTQGLQALERSAEAQSKMIEDLLDVSRMTVGKLRLDAAPTDIHQVLRGAIDSVQPTARAKRIEVDLALEPSIGALHIDPDRIRQVVWNLLTNAIKFTPAGGRVWVRLEVASEHARIVVADNGSGISPKLLPYVFERFRQGDATAKRLQSGLGIGLTITRQLVELHGGTVHAESPGEGLGATFTIELPYDAAAAFRRVDRAAASASTVAVSDGSLKGVRVLLVEDDSNTREALALTLCQSGADVTAVSSGGSVLEALSAATATSRPDVLLSDFGLPGMDGCELLRRVRSLERQRGEAEVPAALLTAYARPDDRERAYEAGFAAHLAKPVEPSELVAVVAQLARAR